MAQDHLIRVMRNPQQPQGGILPPPFVVDPGHQPAQRAQGATPGDTITWENQLDEDIAVYFRA